MIEATPCKVGDDHTCNVCVKGHATFDFRFKNLMLALCDECQDKLAKMLMIIKGFNE